MNARNRIDYVINMSLAAIAGLSGCMAALLTLAALLTGLALDNLLDSDRLFTAACTVCSVPVSLTTLMVVVIWAAKRIEKRQYGG